MRATPGPSRRSEHQAKIIRKDEETPVTDLEGRLRAELTAFAKRADPALIRQMETGQQLKLEVADTNLLSVSTMLPLSQFASLGLVFAAFAFHAAHRRSMFA